QKIDRLDLRHVVHLVVVIDDAIAIAEELRIANIMDADVVSIDFGIRQHALLIDPVAVIRWLPSLWIKERKIKLRHIPLRQINRGRHEFIQKRRRRNISSRACLPGPHRSATAKNYNDGRPYENRAWSAPTPAPEKAEK